MKFNTFLHQCFVFEKKDNCVCIAKATITNVNEVGEFLLDMKSEIKKFDFFSDKKNPQEATHLSG
jgi:hypothetical protein